MIQVDHNERLIRFGIGEAEHSTTQSGRHFGFDTIILQQDGIVIGRSPLLVMGIA